MRHDFYFAQSQSDGHSVDAKFMTFAYHFLHLRWQVSDLQIWFELQVFIVL